MTAAGCNVMLMEQDRKALDEVAAILGSFGMHADGYTDPSAATAAVQTSRFDGIFVESAMLDGAADEVTRQARRSAANEQTPIVVLADHADDSKMQRAFQAGGTFFVVKSADRGQFSRLLELTRLAMLEQNRRTLSVPFAAGVACAVNDYCFSTPAVALSECCIRVRRHQSLVLGATANLSFRLPDGSCMFLTGTVHAHEGQNTALQLHPMSQADRYRLRQFIRENAAPPA